MSSNFVIRQASDSPLPDKVVVLRIFNPEGVTSGLRFVIFSMRTHPHHTGTERQISCEKYKLHITSLGLAKNTGLFSPCLIFVIVHLQFISPHIKMAKNGWVSIEKHQSKKNLPSLKFAHGQWERKEW